uniref:Uncharacterized protein n=1 Tax=Arundo donax TaxID=35708 RepID=A0A0A9BYI9_ARUDO
MYYLTLHVCAEVVLNNENGEDRMKMELANIIRTRHSDDKPLVEAVRRHFYAEHMFMDDPLACVLGSPGKGMESNNLSENTGAVLKRREQQNRRRSHRHGHHHRNADKFAVL